jgi:hypothetical protein
MSYMADPIPNVSGRSLIGHPTAVWPEVAVSSELASLRNQASADPGRLFDVAQAVQRDHSANPVI